MIGRGRRVADPFGIACPNRRCATFWSPQHDEEFPCREQGHTVRTCPGCSGQVWSPPPCKGCRE